MKLLSITVGLVLLLGAAGAQAQMYKWVDEKGVTHFSDQPPPANVKKVDQKPLETSSGPPLPFELAEAVRNFPVTLYTSGACAACDQGRKLLTTRGIPFKEKTVSNDDDHAKLAEAGSQGQVPLLVVGRNKLIGFEASQWNDALTNANYPTSRKLPAGYRQGPAETAASRGPTPDQKAADAARVAAAAKEERDAEERIKRKLEQDKDKPQFQF